MVIKQSSQNELVSQATPGVVREARSSTVCLPPRLLCEPHKWSVISTASSSSELVTCFPLSLPVSFPLFRTLPAYFCLFKSQPYFNSSPITSKILLKCPGLLVISSPAELNVVILLCSRPMWHLYLLMCGMKFLLRFVLLCLPFFLIRL